MKMDMLRFIGASSVEFPIIGADPSGPFVLKGADGLGPTEVTVRMARTVLEKAVYQGKSASLRQVTAVVGLQPNWDVGQTADEIRGVLYGLLTPRYGQMVRCEIVSGGVVQGYVQGHISKMEPAMFTKDPAVQIVLDCDYAYILAPDSVIQEPVQSAVSGQRAFTVLNDGTAPSGFLAAFTLMANVGTSLVLSDGQPGGQRIQIDGINWVAGDIFKVDTRPGSRGVWRGAGGAAPNSPVLNNLNADVSEWMYLYGGNNTLYLNTTAFDWDPTIKFAHQPAYWGV